MIQTHESVDIILEVGTGVEDYVTIGSTKDSVRELFSDLVLMRVLVNSTRAVSYVKALL